GTSTVKCALFDREGRVVAEGKAAYPLIVPERGWAEQRPDEWWQAMRKVTARVLAEALVEPTQVAGLGIAAQMCGVVPVEDRGAALRNALIWLDTRSSDIAKRLTGGWPSYAGYGLVNALRWLRATGGAPNRAGRDATTKMAWLREREPSVWGRVHK